MIDKSLYPFRKRLNTQIITKKEIALDAIKRNELDQSKINFQKNSKFNEKNMLNEMENDYSKLTPHKKIELDQVYHISLFTYSQQFYCLQMINYVFPMRVLIKNVKNDGVLYIGYDQQYPGIYHQNKLSIFENQSESERNYDFKETINRDMLITLKSKGNKMVRYIYFTFTAGSSLLMFDFKVEFLGFVRNGTKDRLLSQRKFKNPLKFDVKAAGQKSQILTRQKTQPQKTFKRSKFPQISRINNEKLVKLEQFHVFTEQMPKHFSKDSLSPSKQLSSRKNTNNSRTLAINNKNEAFQLTQQAKIFGGINMIKGDVDLKIQEAKRNKQLHEIFKLKDKQLRELSGKCKRLIENYQKVYNQESVRKRKLNKDVVMIMYSMLYVSKIHKNCQKTIKRQNMAFKCIYLCKRFIKKLKKRYEQTCKMQPYRYKRAMAQTMTAIQSQSKLMYKASTIRASKIIRQTFSHLLPFININNSIIASNDYRNKVILIQRTWRSKYQNRIATLLQFIDRHVEKMTKEYPNLKVFVESFYNLKANRQICLGYIKDQSQKYRFIHDAYQRKLEQIEEMLYVNHKYQMDNSNNKSRFIIPKKPIKPIHRFYRNCDILRSMIRNWFQIQFKKYMKKSQKNIK